MYQCGLQVHASVNLYWPTINTEQCLQGLICARLILLISLFFLSWPKDGKYSFMQHRVKGTSVPH